MEANKRGGFREGSGRKPTGIKKKPVTLYIEEGKMYKFGGDEKMKQAIYSFVDSFGVTATVQDLSKPTHEIKPIEQPKSNYEVKIPPSPSALPLGDFEAFKAEILRTTIVQQIEAVMKKVKASLLPFGLKKQLEETAKQHSKSMYND